MWRSVVSLSDNGRWLIRLLGASAALEAPYERDHGEHRSVREEVQRGSRRRVGVQANQGRRGGNDGQRGVQDRHLRVRQTALHQPLVVVRAVRRVPPLALQQAPSERRHAVEQKRSQDDNPELDRQSTATNTDAAQEGESGQAEAEEGA